MRAAARNAASTFVACAMVAALPAVVSAQGADVHAEAVALYQRGDVAAAIDRLSSLTDAQVSSAATAIERRKGDDPSARSRAMRRVILLHTEKWFTPQQQMGPFTNAYFDSARSLVRALERTPDRDPAVREAERAFVRDWYLLIVSFFHTEAQVGRGRLYLDEARRLFPRDAQLLLAAGSDAEMLSVLTFGYVQRFDADGRLTGQDLVDGEEELHDALRFLREAVAADAELLEARLRLGRVLYRRGDVDGAARELDIVYEKTTNDILKYLAALFLAQVETRRGRLDRAGELYGTAQRLFPTAQTVVVGLAELAYLRGRPADAASVVVPLLGRVERQDPWWVYVLGEGWHFTTRLAALRAIAQP